MMLAAGGVGGGEAKEGEGKRQRIEGSTLAGVMAKTAVVSTTAEADALTPEAVRKLYIGTHSGSFHCDEALACSLLKVLPAYADAAVVRSRNPEELAKCDIVVDVGATYDAEAKRFDHHQREFDGTLGDGYKTKLSSAGLVYKHYGRDVITELAGGAGALDAKTLEIIYKKVYTGFVEHVDGIDNGIPAADGDANYQVTTSLSSRVGFLNPDWNEDGSNAVRNARFKEAMALCVGEFNRSVQGLVHSWLPARTIVEKSFAARKDVHPSGQIVRLDQFCPWASHLFDIEKELGLEADPKTQILYALFQDSGGTWRIRAVAESNGSFTCRKPLPFRGLRDDVLSKESGIEGCVFIHAAGFIGGVKTYEGALQMAIKALEQ